MPSFRKNFLNWRPDAEDFGNDGLVTADNVIHETEGYKPAHLESAGGFKTTGGLAGTTATVMAVQARPVGSQGDLLVAWLSTPATPTLHIGINGVTGTTSATGYPLAFSTAYAGGSTNAIGITAFDVTEYGGKIFWTVEANFKTDVATSTVTNVKAFAGYMDF